MLCAGIVGFAVIYAALVIVNVYFHHILLFIAHSYCVFFSFFQISSLAFTLSVLLYFDVFPQMHISVLATPLWRPAAERLTRERALF